MLGSTDDALHEFRSSIERGLKDLREDVQLARAEAAQSHQLLRENLAERLSDAVEARVRIQLLEESHKAAKREAEERHTAAIEGRRWLWVQVIAVSGVVATVFGVIVALVKH